MKKTIKIVGILLLLFLLIFIVYKMTTYKEKSFNKIEFSKDHAIYNFTNNKYLDTIIEAGLQSMKIDNVTIIIKKIENTIVTMLGEDIDLKAYIKTDSDGIYYIFIGDYNKFESVEILAHELIHLKQYYDKKLVVNGNGCIWENDTIDVSNITYEKRPWEIDAFFYQTIVSNNINDILYGKNIN